MISLKKNLTLLPSIKSNRVIVKVGLEAPPTHSEMQDTSTNKDKSPEPNLNCIPLSTKIITTGLLTSLTISPPLAGYKLFGKWGLVGGCLVALPVGLLSTFIIAPLWFIDSCKNK